MAGDRKDELGDERVAAGRASSDAPEVTSQSLFQGGNEVVIRHGDERYRLRLTKQNKLILNK